MIVHKCVNQTAPVEMIEMFRPVKSDRTKKLDVPTYNGLMGLRAISVCGPRLWNALPSEFRMETCPDKFKKSLKTFLFRDNDKFYDVVNRK